VQNLRRYACNSLVLFFFFFHEWIENSSSLADFQRVLLLILIITRTSQALVTGKRSYIESCCCVCVCVCCHCFSSGVKIKRKRERRHVNCRILIYCTLGKNSFCRVSVERETARRSFVRNVDVAPFHHLSSSSLL
jgi:hypothetical protein